MRPAFLRRSARMGRLLARLEPTAGMVLAVVIGVVLAEVLAGGWAHVPAGLAQ